MLFVRSQEFSEIQSAVKTIWELIGSERSQGTTFCWVRTGVSVQSSLPALFAYKEETGEQ